jgi:hypothetical protein
MIEPHEEQLTGGWVAEAGGVVGDPVTERIESLVAGYLQPVATDPSGWDQLYRDPGDGRYWELTYPQSGLHGGGPPQLTCLKLWQIADKYGVAALDEQG